MSTTLYMFSPFTGEYVGQRPAQVVNGKALTRSAYATLTPPPASIPDGHAARWTGNAWEVVEDHRQHLDKQGTKQGGTPYWLPSEGDDWQSPPRYMDTLGLLPEGAITSRPEKPAPTQEELFTSLRAERNRRLSDSDYLLMVDYPLPGGSMPQVENYRKALRDLPAQSGAPWDGGGSETPWPSIPSGLNL